MLPVWYSQVSLGLYHIRKGDVVSYLSFGNCLVIGEEFHLIGNQNKKTNIFSILPCIKHNIVLNVEIKAKEHKRMTENKLKCEKIKDKEKEANLIFFILCWVASQ